MFGWFRKRQRRIDKKFLFPAIVEQENNQERVDRAMLYHIQSDFAWRWFNEWKDDPDMADWMRRIRTYNIAGLNI